MRWLHSSRRSSTRRRSIQSGQVAALSSADPHRVRKRDSRPAGAGRSPQGCRPRSSAARRQFEHRVRQHRRSVVRLVDAARAVSVRGSEDQRRGRRRPSLPPLVDTYGCQNEYSQEFQVKARRSAREAARRSARTCRWMANTASTSSWPLRHASRSNSRSPWMTSACADFCRTTG